MDATSAHASPKANTTQACKSRGRAVLGRLARDKRGNTLAMIAMSIFPLVGLIGGGLDLSRMYIVKTRLQHACDAGALAGRRIQGGGVWNAASEAEANRFFDANIDRNAYGVEAQMQRAFTESAGRVTGTASAQLPMTLMKVFNQPTASLEVACDAEMRLPNTDIMFVLDTTGSMDQIIPGDSNKKINTLKLAVKCFYETVARLDTNADCQPGTPGPTGGTGSEVQIRFGFVPYSTNVNVGRLLPTSHLANSWSYQTREANRWQRATSSSTFDGTLTNTAQTACTSANAAGYNTDSGVQFASDLSSATQTSTVHTIRGWRSANGGSCDYRRITTTVTWTPVASPAQPARTTTGEILPGGGWRYAQLSYDVSALKNGSTWNAGINLPVGTDGANTWVSWEGCIEERQTTRASTYTAGYTGLATNPATANDLNIDLAPAAGNQATLWGPALNEAVFTRGATDAGDDANFTTSVVRTRASYAYPTYDCATQGRKLQEWTTAGPYQTYVDSLSPGGNTYHDIGLLWGARLLSPTGIFSSENAQTSQGGEIERHLIFMTDGETCTNSENYAAYGVEWFDRRRVDTGTPVAGGSDCSNASWAGRAITQQVDARFPAICTAVKNMNITLWVVYFGTADTATKTRMQTCATPGRFFEATNSAALIASFRQIADQISQLRLTS